MEGVLYVCVGEWGDMGCEDRLLAVMALVVTPGRAITATAGQRGFRQAQRQPPNMLINPSCVRADNCAVAIVVWHEASHLVTNTTPINS